MGGSEFNAFDLQLIGAVVTTVGMFNVSIKSLSKHPHMMSVYPIFHFLKCSGREIRDFVGQRKMSNYVEQSWISNDERTGIILILILLWKK